jgi:hypothetical protein
VGSKSRTVISEEDASNLCIISKTKLDVESDVEEKLEVLNLTFHTSTTPFNIPIASFLPSEENFNAETDSPNFLFDALNK